MGSSSLAAGCDRSGFVVIVHGRGTMRESMAVKAFVDGAMHDADATLQFDLSDCTYLDSTFLGALVSLHHRFAKPAPRFSLAAPSERCLALFGPSRLNTLLTIRVEKPELLGEPIPLPAVEVTAQAAGEHVLESHEYLAALGGDNAKAFNAIVQKLRGELKRQPA
jgi:anti-anti-sigma regulatory factor